MCWFLGFCVVPGRDFDLSQGSDAALRLCLEDEACYRDNWALKVNPLQQLLARY